MVGRDDVFLICQCVRHLKATAGKATKTSGVSRADKDKPRSCPISHERFLSGAVTGIGEGRVISLVPRPSHSP